MRCASKKDMRDGRKHIFQIHRCKNTFNRLRFYEELLFLLISSQEEVMIDFKWLTYFLKVHFKTAFSSKLFLEFSQLEQTTKQQPAQSRAEQRLCWIYQKKNFARSCEIKCNVKSRTFRPFGPLAAIY